MRVWPLDFRDFYIEAEYEGAVGAVSLSNDGLHVVAVTASGALGVVDMTTQKHQVRQ